MIPVIVGIVVALIGLALLADAWLPEEMAFRSERRRHERTERSLGGEACIGIAALCMAAALIGRDTWRWGTVMVILGGVMLFAGAVLNRAHLKEMLLFRGAARRADAGEKTENPNERPAERNRIR